MNEPKHLSLFSGIDGFSIGFEAEGFRTVGFAEIDAAANIVRDHWWPGVPNFGDLTKPGFAQRVRETCGQIDVLTGGVPCQPASTLGARRGTADERWLWPDAISITGELSPRVAVFENPPALLTLEDGRAYNGIVSGLAAHGYDCLWTPVPAALFGAGHLRWRIIIIAVHADAGYSADATEPECQCDQMGRKQFSGKSGGVAVAGASNREGLQGQPRNDNGNGGRQETRRPTPETDFCEAAADSQGGKKHGRKRNGVAETEGCREGFDPAACSGSSNDANCECKPGRPRLELQSEEIRRRPDNESDSETITDSDNVDWRKRAKGQDGQKAAHDCPDMRSRARQDDWWMEVVTGIPVLVHGIPAQLAEAATRCTGNAILPQVAQAIARAVKMIL